MRMAVHRNSACTFGFVFKIIPVVDPDLQIRGEGGEGGHSDPERKRGTGRPKKFFSPSGLSLV